jgi:acyl carrier protein
LRRPHQVVLSGVELPWRTDDWRSSAPAAREARAAAFLREEAQRGFDLSTPPLMRLTLVRVEDAAWELFWSTHHLLIDGWSWPVVFDDLATFYDARRAGRPAALPSAPRFRDYVAWLASSRPDDEAYWRRCLDGVTEPTPVDLGGDRASGQRDQAGAVNATLDAGRTAALVALARDARTTLGVVVQAAWGLVLSHGAGDDDVVFGASFSGRPPELPGIGALVGPCVNNVPVRMRVDADLTLGAWLSRLQAESADRTPHQYASPREVQSWSAVPPRHRLFDSIVVVQNYRGGGTRARGSDGLAFRPIEVPEATAFALTLAVTPGTELDVKILFAPSRVAEADAAVWLEALASVLRAMADTGAARGSVATLRARMAPSMRGRAALAAQDARRRASGPAAPPTTELEERIAAIWSDLFQREAVGVDRNFFDLGGHSLLLVQAHARLREALGREIPIVALLRYPTIRTLARHLVGEAGAGSTPGTAQTRARLQRDAAQRRKPINPKRS